MRRTYSFLVSCTQGRDYRYLTTVIVNPYTLGCDQVRATAGTTHTPGYVCPCALTVILVMTGVSSRKRWRLMAYDSSVGIPVCMCVYVCVCVHMTYDQVCMCLVPLCMFARLCICYAYLLISTDILLSCAYTYVRAYVCMYVCMRMYMCA